MRISMFDKSRYHWRNIKGVFRAEEGISAVEFAMIAPVMFAIYFGAIELSLMMTLDRKVTTAAATLGDLAARASTISDSDYADIIQATRMIMQPNDITTARMRLTSIADRDGDGTMEVDWSDGYNMTPRNVGDVYTVPADIVSAGGSVIFAEIEYDYNSPFTFLVTSTKTLKDEFYLRPRRVDFIERVN